MFDTMTRWLNGAFGDIRQRTALRSVILPMADRTSTQPQNTAGLAISSGGATTAKIGATDFWAIVQGKLVKIAASTAMPALVGTITATNFNVFCFFVDVAGTVTVLAGQQAALVGNVVFPQFPQGKCLIGYLIVTYASTFTGGTTPLDTATTIYINNLGDMDPSVLV